MGNWNINIQGLGCHHNMPNEDGSPYEKDANHMAKKFVEELKQAGHKVEAATFTHGGKDDL